MSETKRTLLTGFAVAFLFLCMPFYLQFVGLAPEEGGDTPPQQTGGLVSDNVFFKDDVALNQKNIIKNIPSLNGETKKTSFTVVTEKARIVLSNVAGGSFSSFAIVDSGDDAYKYVGGYNGRGCAWLDCLLAFR